MVERTQESVDIHKRLKAIRLRGFSKVDGYAVTDQDFLKERLKNLGLHSEEFGYSAFDPILLKRVLATGTFHSPEKSDSDEIDCCVLDSKGEIRHTMEWDIFSYLGFRSRDGKAAFIVYDLSKLKPHEKGSLSFDRDVEIHYRFKDPNDKKSAVKAVIVIEDFE